MLVVFLAVNDHAPQTGGRLVIAIDGQASLSNGVQIFLNFCRLTVCKSIINSQDERDRERESGREKEKALILQ